MFNITNHQGNAYRNHNEISRDHVISPVITSSINQQISAFEDAGKKESLYTVRGIVNWVPRKHCTGSSQN